MVTTVTAARFDLTEPFSTGSAQLLAMNPGANAHVVFGVVGCELVVYSINY
jgi:hypothetical protein